MKIERDKLREDEIYSQLAAYFKKRERTYKPGTYHVSDLLSPRQTYFKILDPLPPSRAEIGYFVAGMGHHYIVEGALAMGKEDSKSETTLMLEEGGIIILGTPDHCTEYPDEVKTSRVAEIPGLPEKKYQEQLLSYCVMKGVRVGYIIVLYLAPARNFWKPHGLKTPTLIAWKLEFSQEELDAWKAYMVEMSLTLDKAVAEKNPSLLPLCDPWMCKRKNGERFKAACSWYEQCKPEGRWPLN